METKQVLVMRMKFPDGRGGTMSPRKGKLIAQGSHGSSAFLMELLRKFMNGEEPEIPEEIRSWISSSSDDFEGPLTTKVVCKVETEEELLDVYESAKKAGLVTHLIQDAGRTEFRGETTVTCVAIGPHECSKIDVVTGSLKLL